MPYSSVDACYPAIDFFIAFYISFPFLIVALEIASSSIVADGACLKKERAEGKDWGSAINPRRREPGDCRAAFSFAFKSSGRTCSLELFSTGFCFSRSKETRNFCPPRHGRMIFNELKVHLSCFPARNSLRERIEFSLKNIPFLSLRGVSCQCCSERDGISSQ